MANSLDGNHDARVVALDERRLLLRHRAGDPDAFAALLSLYRAPIYGYLTRCGLDRPTRDDLFQEIFARVHRAADTYQPDRPLKPWLFTIAANAVRTHHRRQRVRQLVFPTTDPGQSRDHAPDAFAHASSSETCAFLEEAIAALPEAQREVVVLSCVERLSHEEIAQVLGAPEATVKTHLHRARKALALALARRKATVHREVSR